MQEAESINDAARFWLILQCSILEQVSAAMVVLGKADSGPFLPVSYWPEGKTATLKLTAVCESAIEEKRGVVREPKKELQKADEKQQSYHVAFPFISAGQVFGAVSLECDVSTEAYLRMVMRQLQWGVAWMQSIIHKQHDYPRLPKEKRFFLVMDLLGICVETPRFQAAATSLVTELTAMLTCDRVSLGFLKGRHIKVYAVSHSAQFGKKSNLIHLIGTVMDEAMDQLSTLVYPAAESANNIIMAHSKLAVEEGVHAICTVPLILEGKVYGALTYEKSVDQIFDMKSIELCEIIASLLGPVLELKLKNDQWLITKVWTSCKMLLDKLFARGAAVFKLYMLLLVSVCIFFIFAEGIYKVTSDARLEGSIQRVVAAPFDGYILDAPARAGDIVKAGNLLAKLDDRDLSLERLNWVSKQNQFLKQYREALAKFERAEVRIMKAKLGQAEAQISLLDEQLAKTRLIAPFDGLVVSGDLSQMMGSPVATGDLLFEIAPLDSYRVILEIDERDIKVISVGQIGKLVLTGNSDDILSFKVNKITPLAETSEGRNYFRVEALLLEKPDYLRPGMKGVGKTEIGSRKLLWIWTHTLVDWLRLWSWTWLA